MPGLLTKEKAKELIERFPQNRILVIGDLMLDRYIWGNVDRISPEAPVPVVEVTKETVSLGGASNVANNISALDGKAYIIGVVGKDQKGQMMKELLKERNIEPLLIEDTNRPTTEKIRILAVSQQLIRIDRESKDKLSPDVEQKIISKIKEILDDIDAVIVSDYGKGVITKNVMDFLVSTYKMIFVDPKPSNFHLYKHITIMTPNKKEAYQSINAPEDMPVEEVGRRIMEALEINHLLITLGAEGMALFNENRIVRIGTKAKKVFDVTGAGDTVIATLAMAKVAGGTWEESTCLSNYAAGYVVGEIGTATVDRQTLLSLVP